MPNRSTLVLSGGNDTHDHSQTAVTVTAVTYSQSPHKSLTSISVTHATSCPPRLQLQLCTTVIALFTPTLIKHQSVPPETTQ